MEKHILNLLNTNLRVIIPDFGAFIIRQKEPLLLVFNEFLRYNDGLLIDYIARTENIEKDMARHQITEFTENMLKELEAGHEVRLEGIGKLRRADSDKTEFVQYGKETSKKVGKKTVEKKSKATLKEPSEPLEIIKEESKPAEKKPDVKAKETADPPKTETGESKVVKKASSGSITEMVGKVDDKKETTEASTPEDKPKSNGSVNKPIGNVPAETRPKINEKSPEQKPVPKSPARLIKEKKFKSQNIIWIVLILVVVALINSWFIFNDGIRNIFNSRKSPQLVADTLGRIAEPDTALGIVSSDSTAEYEKALEDDFYTGEKVKEKAADVVKTNVITGEKRFYIVAGCFRDIANADEMVNELKRQGYKAQLFGTIGNLHAVSYSSFAEKEKALQELSKIREEVAPEAWIVYY
jgi:nucleoid DNA-binding protein